MPLFGDYAGPQFGLDDVKIAKLNTDGSYGTAVDVPSAQLYEVTPQTVNAQLEGDDQITDTHAIAISAQVRIRFGSISVEALEVLTGETKSTSGTTPTRVTKLTIDNVKFPYFGIVGRAFATQDAGDVHVFVGKVKIMEGFQAALLQYGQYAIPELNCMALLKDATYGIVQIIKHETATAIVIPPA